jgi:hypothetical protein
MFIVNVEFTIELVIEYVGIIINFTLLLHDLCLIFSIYFDCYFRVFFNLLFCCIGIIIE